MTMGRPILSIAAALAILCLSACSKGGVVYPRPLQDVHEVLAETDELPPVFGSDEPDHSVDSSDPNAVKWILSKNGSEVMRFTATLQPDEPNQTRVTVTIEAPTESPFGNMDQKLKDNKSIRNLYLVAMNEQIASRLENRPFDMSKTYGALAAATAANIGNISRQMDRAAEAGRKRDEENIRKAYADEAAGH
jgi:hypothetical protein